MPSAIDQPSASDTAAAPAVERYQPPVIVMHWLTLALLVAVYTLIELKGFLPKHSDARAAAQSWHQLCGVGVFVVVWLRLAVRRLYRQTPPIVPQPPRWQMEFAHAMHWVLYAFLIVMPLLGWSVLSAKGHLDLPLGLHLPPLMSPDKLLARTLQGVHETLGNVGYYLIGLHAAAALFHHYGMRDSTLRRMLP
jgi:cytochrome b561